MTEGSNRQANRAVDRTLGTRTRGAAHGQSQTRLCTDDRLGPVRPVCAAGHDINYIALSGTLYGCGRVGDKPTPPINLLGDFGAGAMMLAFGMTSALLNVARRGDGQVIDCAITDGAALLNAMTWGFLAMGQWRDEHGLDLLDTGAHFYDTYECADGHYIAIEAIEPQFYRLLREKLGLTDVREFDDQMDTAAWPHLKTKLADLFRSRPRSVWCDPLEATDACFAPVLSLTDAPSHPHNVARSMFFSVDGVVQPAPFPRFSITSALHPRAVGQVGADNARILARPEMY
jgi:alpha-methylacyl-CoA racemase